MVRIVVSMVLSLLLCGAMSAAGDPTSGQEVFAICSGCHDIDGSNSKVGPTLKNLFLRPTLINGQPVNDATVRTQINNGSNDMPPYGMVLTEQQKDDVIAYLHTLSPATFTLTLIILPAGGGNIVANPTGPYIAGTHVCLTAAPNASRIFTGWTVTGGSLDEAGCLTINGNVTARANFATTPAGTALRFIPVAPCRVADTRNPNGPFGGPALSAGATRNFAISGACGIPASAQAYSLNLTVVPTGLLGYVTLWPTGQSQPLVSTLNSLDGRIKSNAAIVPAGTGGSVSVFATHSTDAIIDINGYFVPSSNASALAFYPLTPCRVADTRLGPGVLGAPALAGGQARAFPILSSTCGIPAGAQAYSLNFTVVPPGSLGYLSIWPTGQSQPVVSTLNAPTGAITANAAIVPAGNGGAIDVFATHNTDVIIDINGYFAPPGAGGYSLRNLTPCRVKDTRLPSGSAAVLGTLAVAATGVACGLPPEARAFVLNATVVPAGSLGYLTLWPNGGAQPVVSTLNALDGSITSNMAIVPTTNGSVNAFATSSTHLILDISGYFAP